MKTVIDAYDTFHNNPSLSGETLELVVEKGYFLKQPGYADRRMKFFEDLFQPNNKNSDET